MKKIMLTLVVSLMFFQTGQAILPPLYQTSNEIKAILDSEELGQKLGSGDVIVMIRKTQKGYEIVTNKHRLQVDINYVPSVQPGPAQFNLKFHNVKNKQSYY